MLFKIGGLSYHEGAMWYNEQQRVSNQFPIKCNQTLSHNHTRFHRHSPLVGDCKNGSIIAVAGMDDVSSSFPVGRGLQVIYSSAWTKLRGVSSSFPVGRGLQGVREITLHCPESGFHRHSPLVGDCKLLTLTWQRLPTMGFHRHSPLVGDCKRKTISCVPGR